MEDSESDQDLWIAEINKCATQSTFRLQNRDAESFCPETLPRLEEERVSVVESNRASRIEDIAISEISLLRKEVHKLSLSIQELNISSGKKNKSNERLSTYQNE